jgi:hypothetical protein
MAEPAYDANRQAFGVHDDYCVQAIGLARPTEVLDGFAGSISAGG